MSREERFPTLKEKVYLNSGSYGLLSLDVAAAYQQYLADRFAKGADWPGWSERVEVVRGALARLLGSGSDEIALVGSASEGMNALASAIPLTSARNRVLVSDFEFPTTAQIWHAQAARGAEVVRVPTDGDDYISAEQFEALIDDRTAMVVATHVCYRNGAKLDIPRIVEAARRHGAPVLLDCYQSVGAQRVDVKALGVDFAAGGMLKYLLGSAGMGFLYVDRRHFDTLIPTTTGWFAQAHPHAMHIHANDPAPDARRFQSGTPPVPVVYAAEAGLKLLAEIGTDAIDERVRRLVGNCLDAVKDAGFSCATPREPARHGPLVAIRSSDEVALVNRLAERGIVVTSRDGNIRAGFHFYNDDEDIAKLIAALHENHDLMLPA